MEGGGEKKGKGILGKEEGKEGIGGMENLGIPGMVGNVGWVGIEGIGEAAALGMVGIPGIVGIPGTEGLDSGNSRHNRIIVGLQEIPSCETFDSVGDRDESKNENAAGENASGHGCTVLLETVIESGLCLLNLSLVVSCGQKLEYQLLRSVEIVKGAVLFDPQKFENLESLLPHPLLIKNSKGIVCSFIRITPLNNHLVKTLAHGTHLLFFTEAGNYWVVTGSSWLDIIPRKHFIQDIKGITNPAVKGKRTD
nr:hypothetical protein Iba_chr01dCG8540 [Ipomoea batatas]